MDRRSTRPWILVLALAACRNGSDSSELVVQGISVPDFGLWECNRPIEFAFEQRIDFASVSTRSIRIRTSAGVLAAGTFAAKAVDTNGDGAPEGTDERVVVFYPSCPLADDLSDAGLTPGARYLVTLAGTDSGADPDAVLRSLSGNALAQTVVHAFETIADPASTLHDERPGAPTPVLRAAGARSGTGTHLELGEDPANRVFFEGSPTSGRTPRDFRAPLNLLGDRATHVAIVVVFDQLIRDTPANLERVRLEYNSTLADSGWRALETRAELLANCRPGNPAVRLVPLGSFPPGGFVRVRIEAGFEDLVGETTSEPLDGFALTEVAIVAFTSLDPAGAIADELREEFDFGPGSPLSFADPSTPLIGAPAPWGQGELRAAAHDVIALPPELSDFDWVVRPGENHIFDTSSDSVLGGPDGERTTVQTTSGGFIAVRNLTVEADGQIRAIGPNPMVVHATGSVTIRGRIDASGFDAVESRSPTSPANGGAGSAGGGAGGGGKFGAGARGGSGSGALGAGVGAGGRGGESGFAPAASSPGARRGGGGGGGRFARDQGSLVAENGGDGEGTGAESNLLPARGGTAGPEVFIDGDPSNDFFGIAPIVNATGAVVARRRGELDHVHAGSGGGNGGDSITAETFPPVSVNAIEGGGGGGGGGGLVIRALGPIVFGPQGKILANGGTGGATLIGAQLGGGAAGGSGAGGHVILESAQEIDFTGGDPSVQARLKIQAIGGERVLQLPVTRGFGGAGGPGVVQLHVPHPERPPGDPDSNVILPLEVLDEPDPLGALCTPRPSVLYLYPSVAARSSARSRWIPLGAAGEGGAGRMESVVAFLFDGIETAPGEDEGEVRTSNARVVELAPLLGPVWLPEVGVELLSDGTSLVLSGPVLAPLRASAQPISPDVYLRTPALLEGHTLRLQSILDPDRRSEFTIARANYDDATSRLTLTAGGLPTTLAETVEALGGAERVELTLLPRFFRVRQGVSGVDLLPGYSVRILFQGAADDGTGRANEGTPLVDWTADVAKFGLLAPGALDFVRFQVEFVLDAEDTGFDPQAAPLALDFLRLPFRF